MSKNISSNNSVVQVLLLGDDASFNQKVQGIFENSDSNNGPSFNIEKAVASKEAFEKISSRFKNGSPLDLALLNLSEDRIEEEAEMTGCLLELDSSLQIIACTENPDSVWDIFNQIPTLSDNMVYLKKPFGKSEILQLTQMLYRKRRLSQSEESNASTSEPGGGDSRIRELEIEKDKIKDELDKRLKMQDKLIVAQKLESMGLMSKGIAHRFNNLLSVVIGNAELLKECVPRDFEDLDVIDKIILAAKKGAELSGQMATFTGKDCTPVDPIDLNRLLKNVTKLLEATVSKKATIHLHCAENLSKISGDQLYIRQMILNLVTNSFEALDGQHGTITVSTEQKHFHKEDLYKCYNGENLLDHDYISVTVKDLGCGMSKEVLDRIFDPFYTTKFEGRGLGLAAVQGIMKAHHGTIQIHSEEKKGTEFSLMFPVGKEIVPRKEPESKTTPVEKWVKSAHILLVDDENEVRSTMATLLKIVGFDVVEASEGQQAINLFRDSEHGFDIALLDMVMPEMNGQELFHALRKIQPDLPVLFVSGFPETELDEKIRNQQGVRFLEKPYSIKDLRKKLQDTLRLFK
jgi:signal transduction histidine kinase/CheY-like chemotaxis protein